MLLLKLVRMMSLLGLIILSLVRWVSVMGMDVVLVLFVYFISRCCWSEGRCNLVSIFLSIMLLVWCGMRCCILFGLICNLLRKFWMILGICLMMNC